MTQSWSWYLVRVSGLLLVVLGAVVFADRFLVHDTSEVDALFLLERWRSGPWLLAEWAFLLLASVHGVIGVRWTVRRHVSSPTLQLAVQGVVIGLTGALLLGATWTMFTLP